MLDIKKEIESLLIIDPLAERKGHLIEDDYFWIRSFYQKVGRLKLVSSMTSILNIRKDFPDVNAKPFVFLSEYLNFFRHLKYLCRLFFINTRGFSKILFQSFSEPAAYMFSLLHPGKEIYLIVTNNLTGQGVLSPKRTILQQRLFSKVKAIVVHTRYEKELIKKIYPNISQGKVFIKPFHKISEQRIIPGLAERKRRISYFGRSVVDRGIDDFFKMASLDRDSKFTYGIYGQFEFTAEQKKLISSIKADIDVCSAYLSSEKYYRLIGQSMFIALPYKKTFEGRTSGVLCDAIACGTPIIGSNIEPHIEYFEKYGSFGYLVDFSNTEEIEKVINAPLDSWGDFQKSLEIARQENSPEKIISCMLKIFRRIESEMV